MKYKTNIHEVDHIYCDSDICAECGDKFTEDQDSFVQYYYRNGLDELCTYWAHLDCFINMKLIKDRIEGKIWPDYVFEEK